MTNKHGPTKGDLQFRLAFSVVGLGLVAVSLIYRGLPTGPGGWEAIGLGTALFGGTLIWTVRKLIKGDHS